MNTAGKGLLECIAMDVYGNVRINSLYEEKNLPQVRVRLNLSEKTISTLEEIADNLGMKLGGVIDEYFTDGGFNLYSTDEYTQLLNFREIKTVTKTITMSKIARDNISLNAKILQISRNQYLEYAVGLLQMKIEEGNEKLEYLSRKAEEALLGYMAGIGPIANELLNFEHPYLNGLRRIFGMVGFELSSIISEFEEHWNVKLPQSLNEDFITKGGTK